MTSAPTPLDLRTLAPALALRIGPIFAALRDLVAARFLRDPRLVLFIVPLWSRLGRAARRFDRLMARLAAGHLPVRRVSRSGSGSGGGAPKPTLPAAKGWLLRALRHEAAIYTMQLEHLLAEPGMAEFVAATPTVGRILRPLCHMLGVRNASPGVRNASPGVRHASPSVTQPHQAPQPIPAPAPAKPPRAERQPALLFPRPVVPLCPRLELRWPWIALPGAQST